MCFYLALTYGLAEDPVGAITRMVARVERARREHHVELPFRATMCASDGTQLIVLRWTSPDVEGYVAPSLYHSSGPTVLHAVDGDADMLPEDAQLVVSEPLELQWSSQVWNEVPAGSIGVFAPGKSPRFAPLETK